MLKRIHEIRNVGRFEDCRAGGVEFGRLTFVYGRNTYGKSTLGDIFASISTGDVSLITGRTTIPDDGHPQRIRFSVQVPNSAAETEVKFEGGTWTRSVPTGLGIKVFDDGFLHNNLFAARAVTRATKENFNAYILGEQGVHQAKMIADKKRDRQQLSRDRKAIERDAFSGIDDIPQFVATLPNGTKDEANERLQTLRADLTALREQRRAINNIQARAEGAPINWTGYFSRSINAVNEVLPLGLEGTHEAAKARVAQHIEDNFGDSRGAERWVREGLSQNNGKKCQFCGQELSAEANELLDAYRQAFDAAFDQHEHMVRSRLDEALGVLDQFRTDSIRAVAGTNAAALAGYPELVGKTEFDEVRRRRHSQ